MTINKKSMIIIPISVLLILSFIFFISTNYNHDTKTEKTTSAPKNVIKSQQKGTDENTTSSDKAISPPSGELIAPSGSFVSNHTLILSKSSSMNQEVSVCNSSVGAECWIEFIKNEVTKSLDHKVIGSSGSVFWNWQPNDIKLTAGSWTIKANSSLRGQTKSTTDLIPLEVKP